ncbi:hypothetical protein BH24BAC1_BH24BAC1_30300 [soil metagenome]
MRNLAREHFGVSYGRRQMQRLARELNMYCYKPQPRDYRQADGACCRLKERVQAVAEGVIHAFVFLAEKPLVR